MVDIVVVEAQSFLYRARPKTRGLERGSRSVLSFMAHVFSWPTPTSFPTNILHTAVDSIPPAFYIKHVMPERRAFGVKIPRQRTSVRRLKLPATSSHRLTMRELESHLVGASGVPETIF